ncbi:response regulator transcription factor [Sphingosinicella terrae]|uniref:response regulator transcription factor n=1 Tax=Sphingosinicella terrae TaxID=2172047 RepID=UPI000E0CDA90|nr:response regulator transcription factor [Sphingosinicella terrae]
MRVIVVDEDPIAREPLVRSLRQDGFVTDAAECALEFYRGMAMDGYDIAIIDIGLPDENGLQVASWLRSRGDAGIILLGKEESARDRIDGFRSGADLYFAKPVDGDELAEATRSLARRLVRGEPPLHPSPAPTPVAWYFDAAQWRLQSPDGKSVKLTATEQAFFQRLVLQPGRAAPRHDLRAELGYREGKAADQSLDALVRRLRRKIERDTGDSAPIQTVHGQGYLFSAPLRRERRRPPN